MEKKLGVAFGLKCFFFPNNNHWFKRILLVFAFIFFDYFITLISCQFTYEEANLYARGFMEILGVPLGLTLFVFMANLPIYMTLSLDSHIIRFPPRIAVFIEVLVDIMFAWFVAGSHFSGGTSWLWYAPEWIGQSFGTLLYLIMAFLIIKPHKLQYGT